MKGTAPAALRHLLSIDDLTPAQFSALLDSAERILADKSVRTDSGALSQRIIANLFFEPSTRTRVAFEIAARRLGAHLVNFEIAHSSRNKGEADSDTLATLAAMGVSIFVLRTAVAGLPAQLAQNLGQNCSLINAGEAEVAHPTQGLLDMLTIRRHKPQVADLRVAIVGDIVHSRVARSAVRGLRHLGVSTITLVGPETFLPDPGEMPDTTQSTDLLAGIDGADVIMVLRIQRERMALAELPDGDEYFARFGLTERTLRAAAHDAIVMHPGPVNRGIEIDDEVADGPRSVIREQVANGVAMRMAILTAVAQSLDNGEGEGST